MCFPSDFSLLNMHSNRRAIFGELKAFLLRDMPTDPIFLLQEYTLTSEYFVALHQATATHIGAAGLYFKGSGIVNRMLYTCARQHSQCNG